MAVNAFISFFDKADGESVQRGKERWVEIQAWDWEVEADTSWTKGGGASVAKPNPGSMNFEHQFDTSSTVILGYICTGKAFPKVELQMTKPAAGGRPETFFTMLMGRCVHHQGQQQRNRGRQCGAAGRVGVQNREDRMQAARRGRRARRSEDLYLGHPAGTASPSA